MAVEVQKVAGQEKVTEQHLHSSPYLTRLANYQIETLLAYDQNGGPHKQKVQLGFNITAKDRHGFAVLIDSVAEKMRYIDFPIDENMVNRYKRLETIFETKGTAVSIKDAFIQINSNASRDLIAMAIERFRDESNAMSRGRASAIELLTTIKLMQGHRGSQRG